MEYYRLRQLGHEKAIVHVLLYIFEVPLVPCRRLKILSIGQDKGGTGYWYSDSDFVHPLGRHGRRNTLSVSVEIRTS